MLNINNAINEFLTDGVYKKIFPNSPYQKSTVRNVLKSLEIKAKEISSTFEMDELQFNETIVETVKGYSSNKKTAIIILKKMIEYLVASKGFDANIKFPPIDISNSFERQMYLAKILQTSDITLAELSDALWISERTLNEDIARIRGHFDDPIQICGKVFKVNEISRNRGKVNFTSTVHPMFMTFNITQVIATLKGLKYMGDDPVLKQYALLTARQIWEQLSDYAKKRILYVTMHLIPDDAQWYKGLDSASDVQAYRTESELSHTEGAGVIADCLKNKKTCIVEYSGENGESIFLENCSVFYSSDGNISVENDSGKIELSWEKILRSAYTKVELI